MKTNRINSNKLRQLIRESVKFALNEGYYLKDENYFDLLIQKLEGRIQTIRNFKEFLANIVKMIPNAVAKKGLRASNYITSLKYDELNVTAHVDIENSDLTEFKHDYCLMDDEDEITEEDLKDLGYFVCLELREIFDNYKSEFYEDDDSYYLEGTYYPERGTLEISVNFPKWLYELDNME